MRHRCDWQQVMLSRLEVVEKPTANNEQTRHVCALLIQVFDSNQARKEFPPFTQERHRRGGHQGWFHCLKKITVFLICSPLGKMGPLCKLHVKSHPNKEPEGRRDSTHIHAHEDTHDPVPRTRGSAFHLCWSLGTKMGNTVEGQRPSCAHEFGMQLTQSLSPGPMQVAQLGAHCLQTRSIGSA